MSEARRVTTLRLRPSDERSIAAIRHAGFAISTAAAIRYALTFAANALERSKKEGAA